LVTLIIPATVAAFTIPRSAFDRARCARERGEGEYAEVLPAEVPHLVSDEEGENECGARLADQRQRGRQSHRHRQGHANPPARATGEIAARLGVSDEVHRRRHVGERHADEKAMASNPGIGAIAPAATANTIAGEGTSQG
jgi:hypothetical protein